jgi:hypothetical protein
MDDAMGGPRVEGSSIEAAVPCSGVREWRSSLGTCARALVRANGTMDVIGTGDGVRGMSVKETLPWLKTKNTRGCTFRCWDSTGGLAALCATLGQVAPAAAAGADCGSPRGDGEGRDRGAAQRGAVETARRGAARRQQSRRQRGRRRRSPRANDSSGGRRAHSSRTSWGEQIDSFARPALRESGMHRRREVHH